MNKNIPIIALQRMPIYLNYLRKLPKDGERYISSGGLAAALGLGEVLVRKDLAYTDCVGKPKVGYDVQELIAALEDFLCCYNNKTAVIVGVGGLGKALLSYNGFDAYAIKVIAGFDKDEKKIGNTIAGKPVYDVADLKEKIAELGAFLAIICVPEHSAQSVCDSLAKTGIKAVLNFAPVSLNAPDGVIVRNIDLAANLAVLATMVL